MLILMLIIIRSATCNPGHPTGFRCRRLSRSGSVILIELCTVDVYLSYVYCINSSVVVTAISCVYQNYHGVISKK